MSGPDIDAREAFREILQHGEWMLEEEKRNNPGDKFYSRDFTLRRLSDEIHQSLRQGRLGAWGEELLPGESTTSEKPIPAEKWDTLVIDFYRNRDVGPATAHYKDPRWHVGTRAWTGVKFSRQQIFALFPLSE